MVNDEFFSPNVSFEANLSSTRSYCAAAAFATQIRKLGGVNYLSMYPSDSEWRSESESEGYK